MMQSATTTMFDDFFTFDTTNDDDGQLSLLLDNDFDVLELLEDAHDTVTEQYHQPPFTTSTVTTTTVTPTQQQQLFQQQQQRVTPSPQSPPSPQQQQQPNVQKQSPVAPDLNIQYLTLMTKINKAKHENSRLQQELSKYKRDPGVQKLASDEQQEDNVGVILASGNNQILHLNDFMLEKLGYAKEDFKSGQLSFSDIIHPSCVGDIMSWCINNVLNRRNGQCFEDVVFLRKGGDPSDPNSFIRAKRELIHYVYDNNSAGKLDKIASDSRIYF